MPDPFADLLLRLRQEAGRTQEEQAEAINAVSGRDTMTRREISRYENFENIPTNHTIGHIAAACGVPFEELQREARAARARKRKEHADAGEDQDAVKRRTLLVSATIGVSVAAEPWGRLAFALSKGTKIDSPAAAALIDRAAELHVQTSTSAHGGCRKRSSRILTRSLRPCLVQANTKALSLSPLEKPPLWPVGWPGIWGSTTKPTPTTKSRRSARRLPGILHFEPWP
nr:helix-turn-helix transcriptional regulator [Streptomyces griseofuscus]